MKKSRKRLLCVGILGGMALAASLCFPAFALTEGDFEYTLSNNESAVTKYIGSGGNVTVPAELGGAPVTQIGKDAFAFNETVESVSLPDTVTEVGKEAFRGCSLTRIDLPNGLQEIGDSAFDRSGLTSISLPDSVTTFGSGVFINCQALTSVRLPAGLTSIPSQTFYMCDLLKSVELPQGVVSIGGQAFAASGLTSIELPSGVTKIGLSAFGSCEDLETVTLSDCLTSIDNYAFMGCSALKSLYLPATVKTIGQDAFSSTGIASLIVPYGATEVRTLQSSALNEITVPSTVTTVSKFLDNTLTYCVSGSAAEKSCKSFGTSYIIDPSVDSPIHVLYNGSRISFGETGQNPVIEDGRTLVPLRAIFEAMGATVDWDGDTGTITAVRGSDTVKLTIGDQTLYKNGAAVMTLDVPAKVLNGRTVVPARAVAEAFGADVDWIGAAKIVTITE